MAFQLEHEDLGHISRQDNPDIFAARRVDVRKQVSYEVALPMADQETTK